MDFGTLSKSSNMKRKSSSLLAALGKPGSRSYTAPPSSYAAPQGSYAPSLTSSDESHETTGGGGGIGIGNGGGGPGWTSYGSGGGSGSGAGYAESSRSVPVSGNGGGSMTASGRRVSGSTTASGGGGGSNNASNLYSRSPAPPAHVRRVDDVYNLVRERLVQWSYLMQFYNGDVPWLNSVHVARNALEGALGAKALDERARQEFALGLSLAALFDINGAGDFLRALGKLVDEWEAWAETGGSKSVMPGPLRNFFRPQRAKPRPSAAQNTATAEVTIAPVDAQSESFLVLAVMPFTPDYFQVHASTCSIMRDVYKKLLAMVLPASRAGRAASLDYANNTLLHPGTFVLLGPNDGAGPATELVSDAALLGSAEMPANLTLVGEGQKLTPQVIDLLLKVDAKLKKHYAYLVRDGDTITRAAVESELAALSQSLAGGPSLRFTPPTPTSWTEAN